MPSVDWNRRMWNDPTNWKDRGDEWRFHARRSFQPYQAWKHSVVESFIDPYIGPDVNLLELGPGYGRWTEFMVGRVRSLCIVDLNDRCIDACRQRFGEKRSDVTYFVNDGRSLPVPDQSIDLVWSFATLVHVDPPEIDAYLNEFARVLRPGGKFVVHHAAWLEGNARLVTHLPHAIRSRVLKGQWRGRFNRSAMSRRRFSTVASKNGLVVERSIRRWGNHGRFRLAAGDVVSIGSPRFDLQAARLQNRVVDHPGHR